MEGLARDEESVQVKDISVASSSVELLVKEDLAIHSKCGPGCLVKVCAAKEMPGWVVV